MLIGVFVWFNFLLDNEPDPQEDSWARCGALYPALVFAQLSEITA